MVAVAILVNMESERVNVLPEEDHADFQTPASDMPIWRYMDFTKFVDLLEHKGLFFPRSDKFDDPFEGSVPTQNPIALRSLTETVISDMNDLSEITNSYTDMRKFYRKYTFLNCWHMNKHESDAMWKLYTRTNESIAIRSTYDALRVCLPSEVHIGIVQYIDYDTAIISPRTAIQPFIHKRMSFAHEQELRALWFDLSSMADVKDAAHVTRVLDNQTELPAGKRIQVDLDRLIGEVYVSPTSPQWFVELVKAVLTRYGLSKPVVQSALDASPVF